MKTAKQESQHRLEIIGESIGKEGYRKEEKGIPSSRHFNTICHKNAVINICLLGVQI